MNFGVALQATIPYDIKIYIGPYLHFSEGRIKTSVYYLGTTIDHTEDTFRNSNNFGGFAGIDIPATKAIHLNVEGQYCDRLSIGASLNYSF